MNEGDQFTGFEGDIFARLERWQAGDASLSPRWQRLMDAVLKKGFDPSDQAMLNANYDTSENVQARWELYEVADQPTNIEQEIATTLGLDGDEGVLDVGCSDGGFLYRLRMDQGHSGLLFGVDLNPSQFRKSELWLPNSPVWDKAGETELREGSITDLPFPDASVDVVTALFMLYHVPMKLQHKAIAECKRVMARDGRLVVATSGFDNKPQHRVIEENFARFLTELDDSPTQHPDHMNKGFTRDDAMGLLKEHFKHVYFADYETQVTLNTPEKIKKYAASLMSMRDQFRPIPSESKFRSLINAYIGQYIAPRMNDTQPFRDKLSRTLLIATDSNGPTPPGMEPVIFELA